MANAWAFMDPWWQIMKKHRVLAVYGHAGGVSGLAVSLVLRNNFDLNEIEQRCRALRDALELVFLQSVVDRGAFIEALVKHDLRSFKAWLKERILCEDNELPCHVTLTQTFEIPKARKWIRVAISTILTPQRLQERDQAFQDARQQLLGSVNACVVYDKLKITVGFSVIEWALAMRYLANLVQTGPPPAADYPFRRIAVDAFVRKNTVSDQLVADITTCLGDPYKRIQVGSVSVVIDQGTDEAKFGNLLSILLSAADTSTVDQVKEAPGVSLTLTTPTNHRLATQLCSAVMYTRAVEKLTLDWTVDGHTSQRDRTRWMRWITVSLFSSRACHSIRELTLDDFFVDDDDMDDLETCLLSKNPLFVLRGGQDNDQDEVEASSQSRHQVSIAKGTNLLLHPVGTRPVAVKLWKPARLECDGWVDVVVDDAGDADHCEVLVPGYGLCCVRRVDIQGQRVIDESHDIDRQPKHGIKSLSLKWTRPSRQIGENESVVCRFIHLIGAPLEALTVSRLENVTSILQTIWTVCPLLVRLELRQVGSDCLRRLSDAYESGKCRVASLAVWRMQRPSGSPDIIDFCEKLCQSEHLMSRTLTELSLDFNLFRAEAASDEELESLARVLDYNTKLVLFSITGMGFRLDDMWPRFTEHNNQPLPGQGLPLETRAKLAFLSVASPRDASEIEGPRAICGLDSDVIARILETAATPVRRKVWMEEDLY